MKNLLFSGTIFWFLTIIYAEGLNKTGCLDKDEAVSLLETAEDILSKADDAFPSCNKSECGGKLPLKYIEISKKLISDVRENFPTCPQIPTEYDKPSDCSELFAIGHKVNGVYTIWPRELYTPRKPPLQVYCDMKTDKGGWTVIQRRGKFPVQQDFFQDWESYKNGFGNVTQEFWLGNENIRVLCHKGCSIRFDFEDSSGKKPFVVYSNFNLSRNNYTISISGYSGDANDSMNWHNNRAFSTKDRGNTQKAKYHHGGWWYRDDSQFCNLNGLYQPGQKNNQAVFWSNWKVDQNMAYVEIKVKSK